MIDERFSALLDGELAHAEAAELLQRMTHEPALRAAWTRQHRAHALLRGQACAGLGESLAQRIRKQIQQESLIERSSNVVDMTERLLRADSQNADGAAEQATPVTAAAVSMQLVRSSTAAKQAVAPVPARRRTMAASLALAASLVVAAVLVPQMDVIQAPGNIQSASQVASLGWTGVDPATAQKLDDFLLDHHSVAESTLVSLPTAAHLASTGIGPGVALGDVSGQLIDAAYQQR